MKRLLEWKNRMTHSSLRKPNNKAPERHSMYLTSSKNATYRSGNISSASDQPNDDGSISKDSTMSSQKGLNQPSAQVSSGTERNTRLSSPAGAFYQFSSDDDGN